MISNFPQNPLNEAQLTVLNMLNSAYSDSDIQELRKVLAEFNNHKLLRYIENTSAKKNYSPTDFDNMADGHERKNATKK